MNQKVAVVLMAYGTPRSPAEIELYYIDIRRGHPPTPEALNDLTRRYAAIGGVSPLAETTESQRQMLQASLEQLDPGRYDVVLGLKHADPQIEETALAVVREGYESIVGLVLAPHYSAFSVGQYLDRLQQSVADSGSDLTIAAIMSWASEPAFINFLAEDLGARLHQMRESIDGRVRVLFTAHSLPERTVATGDPYVHELDSTARAVADRLGLIEGGEWQIAWQSAGRTTEAWIGPDVLQVIDELGAEAGVGGVIVCSCGFVADHLEVLYDLDIEAAERSAKNNLKFDRTASVNLDRAIFDALASRVGLAAEERQTP